MNVIKYKVSTLVKMACDVLSVPATIATFKMVFNVKRKVMIKYHGSLLQQV